MYGNITFNLIILIKKSIFILNTHNYYIWNIKYINIVIILSDNIIIISRFIIVCKKYSQMWNEYVSSL